MTYFDQIQETAAFIKSITTLEPELGFIFGTGLNGMLSEIEVDVEIPYADLPHFPLSTVQSHQSKLILGTWEGKKVMALGGRFHYYEGYSMKEVTFPVRVMKALGVSTLLMSNVAGSVNQHLLPGDIVLVKDHINLLADNPLRGMNDERLGVRFPDMMGVYDQKLLEQALEIASRHAFRTHVGIYAALQGPNLETKAEYMMLHHIGADLVGMSTVPEAIVAKHAELKLLVASVVSNQCYPIELIRETTVEEVIAVARMTEPKLRTIFKELVHNF